MYRQTLFPLLAAASILGHCPGSTSLQKSSPPAQYVVDTSTHYNSRIPLIGNFPVLDLSAEIAVMPLGSSQVIITVWMPEDDEHTNHYFAMLEEVVEKWHVPLVGFEERPHGQYQEAESFGDLGWLVERMEESGATPLGMDGRWSNFYDLFLKHLYDSITEGIGKYNAQHQQCREIAHQRMETVCQERYSSQEEREECHRLIAPPMRNFCQERHAIQREHIKSLQGILEKIMSLFGPYTFPLGEDPKTGVLTADETHYDSLARKFNYSWGAYETVDSVLESMRQHGASQALLLKGRGAMNQLNGHLNARGISHIDIFARSGDMELYDEEPLSVEDVHYYQEQMNDLLFREWKVSIDAWIKEKE